MTDQPTRPAHLFAPGHSGNPGGRRSGNRAKLATRFFQDIYAAWEERGDAVIRQVAFHDPAKFLAVVAHLMPQKIEVAQTTDGLSDERMEQLIELASIMAAGASPALLHGQSGDGAPGMQMIEGEVVEAGGGGRAGAGPLGGENDPSHTADRLIANTPERVEAVQNFSAENPQAPPISRVAEELEFPEDPLGVDPHSLF
jgi:hypothetical protein